MTTHCERDTEPREEVIEITPEMIAVGVVELCQYDPREDEPEPIVLAIFEEMIKRHGKYLCRCV
jgi:hypothetical protein